MQLLIKAIYPECDVYDIWSFSYHTPCCAGNTKEFSHSYCATEWNNEESLLSETGKRNKILESDSSWICILMRIFPFAFSISAWFRLIRIYTL